MADLRVRFIGDLNNYRQFFGAIEGQADKVALSLNNIGRTQISSQLNVLKNIASGPIGSSGISKLNIDLDQLNNTIKTTGQIGLKLSNGEILPISQFQQASGNVKNLVSAYQRYVSVLTESDRVESQNKQAIDRTTFAIKERAAAIYQAGVLDSRARIADLRAGIATSGQSISGVRATLAPIPALDTADQTYDRQRLLNPLLEERRRLIGLLGSATQGLARNEKEYDSTVENDGTINALKRRLAILDTTALAESARLGVARDAAKLGVQQAYNAPPQYPANLLALQKISPNLFSTLQKAGLGTTADEIINTQQASFSAPRLDLVRGVTKLTGEFTKTTKEGIPVVQEFAAEVDKNGKVVTRFGGQLSGVSNTLKQIVRDFQKVIEWTVATTLVFGTLAYAIQQLNNLKELDYSLQKFAITAQQSPTQAAQSFTRLSEIAINTATPLNELIGAADDIALATKKAGQSTEEWSKQIFSLTESVGVFTNLTGTDTVKATDLLTATMKQLGLSAADIPPILSKITAVAGGQSQAISDITQGLSVMAQAGKVANLTVDQQIATVQVLSQVTSKTPAEVATAFKNLVGSLGSPAAIKGLESFNIAVRDQAGNLRNILDIYKEISEKIKSGVIPAADVQGLIRAISGGPRRAPDAAALLEAIDQITVATRKSKDATNEASIANAKALDTSKAKLIQLQNAVDTAVFVKFGQAFKDSVGSLLTVLTQLLKLFNLLPTGIIVTVLQVGLFSLAVRAGVRIGSAFIQFLRDTAASFVQVAESALLARNQVAGYNATTGSPTGLLGPNGQPLLKGAAAESRLSILAKTGGKIALGGAIAGGLSAANGDNGFQVLGNSLQGVGLAATIYAPGFFKLGGAALFAAGYFLQLANATKQSTDALADNQIKVLDAYASYKDSSTTLNDLTTAQKTLAEGIATLNGQAHKSATEQTDLSSKQDEYTKNLLDIIDATTQLNESRKTLLDTLPAEESAAIREIQNYNTTGKSLDELILKYQQLVLARAGITTDTTLPQPSTSGNAPFTTGNTTATITTPYHAPATGEVPLFVPDNITSQLDLKTLTTQADHVKDLFDSTGSHLVATFDISQENIAYVTGALKKLSETQPELAANMLKTANAFFAQKDAVTQLSDDLKIYQTYIDGISFIKPDEAANLQKVLDLTTKIINYANTPTIGVGGSPDDRQETADKRSALIEETKKVLADSFKNGSYDIEGLKKLATDFYAIIDEGSKKDAPLVDFMTQLFERAGFDLKEMGLEAQKTLDVINEDAGPSADALDKIGESLESNISDKIAKIQADLQAGLIKPGLAAKEIAALKAYGSAISGVVSSFDTDLRDISGFFEALHGVQGEFSKIPGLENAASLSTEDFVGKILELADTYGLNGKQLGVLAGQLLSFRKIVEDLSHLKVTIPIEVLVKYDTKQLQAMLTILKVQESLYKALGIPLPPATQALLDEVKDILLLSTLSNNIKNTFSGGSGTNIGGTPKTTTKATLDVSTLDLPKEITTAINESDLIQQAIKNAKTLQSQIPGANKDAKNDVVELLDGTMKILEVRGVKEEYLRKALEELAAIEQKRLDFETKADTVRRIRIGAGDFSAIANVPVNSVTGVSASGSGANILLNITGTVLTPAQFQQFANMVAAAIYRNLQK